MTIIKTPDCTLLHVGSFCLIIYKVTMGMQFCNYPTLSLNVLIANNVQKAQMNIMVL